MLQDLPISLLPPAGSLTGAEQFAFSQNGETVEGSLNAIRTFVLTGFTPGTGDLLGTLTAGYIPVATGLKNLGNSRITQTNIDITIPSPDTGSYFKVSNSGFIATYELNSNVYGDSGRAGIQWADGTNNTYVEAHASFAAIGSVGTLQLYTSGLYADYATASRVAVFDSSKNIIHSAITTTELGNLSGSRSNLQVQIDALYSNLSWKQEVMCATTANITLSGLQTIDGYTTLVDDRVLVKDQSTGSQNCIYIAKTTGWVRATDCDSTSEVVSATVQVRFGTVNKDTQWSCSNTNQPVIGTDAITFVKINGGNVYTNGAGLSLSGNQFSIGAGQIVNSMIQNNSIDLSSKVTSILKQVNGGTGIGSNPSITSIPFQNTATAYGYDQANFNYDPTTKTLNLNNLYISPDDNIIGINVEAANSNAARFQTFNAGFEALIIEAAGDGMKVDSATGTAGRFSSTETAGEYNQYGIITADVAYEAFVVNRNYERADASSAKATGPMHLLNDASIFGLSTGSGYKYQKKDATGALIRRFETLPTGEVVFNTQTDITGTISGTIEVDTTQSGTVGSTPKDVFTKSIKASCLNNIGDSIKVEYSLIYNETTKTKSFTVFFGGVTLYASPAFALLTSPGSGKIEVLIIKTGTNAISYHVTASVTDGSDITSPVLYIETSGTATPTLTSANTLRVNAVCSSGSANNGVVSNFAVYKYNPKV